jgi:hypothetical protein
VLHKGVGLPQSPSSKHSAQVRLCVWQSGVAGVSAQWLFCMHSTQTWFVTKHAGVVGVSVQSAFRPHSTQVWV